MKKPISVTTSKNFRLMEVASLKDLSEVNLAERVIFKLPMDLRMESDFLKHIDLQNKTKLDKISSAEDKLRFIKTRGLVNILFLHDNGGANPIWKLNSYGKPYIEGWDKDFSISHTRDLSLVAVASEAIGIDIEDNSRDIDLEKFKRTKFLNFDEGAYDNKEEFLMRFTALEAYLKYLGKGFYKDARTISVKKVNDGIVIDDGGLIKAEVIKSGGYTISIVMNKKGGKIMDREKVKALFDKYTKKLRIVPEWDIRLEFVEDSEWKKTGDFKIDPTDKKAVLMLNAVNPKDENIEETIVHELMHIKMYPLDQVCESMIINMFDEGSKAQNFAYQEFFTTLEVTVEELAKCFLYEFGENKELSYGRMSKIKSFNELYDGLNSIE